MSIRNQYTELFDSGYYNDVAKFKATGVFNPLSNNIPTVSPCGSRGENTDFEIKEDDVKRPKLDIKRCFSESHQSKLIKMGD